MSTYAPFAKPLYVMLKPVVACKVAYGAYRFQHDVEWLGKRSIS